MEQLKNFVHDLTTFCSKVKFPDKNNEQCMSISSIENMLSEYIADIKCKDIESVIKDIDVSRNGNIISFTTRF